MARWNRGKDKADTAASAPFAIPEWVIDSGQHYREAAELARTGSRGQATITSVAFGGKHYDGVVWTMGMRVQPNDGEAFDAELALALDAEFADDPRERSARPPRSCSTPPILPECGSSPRTLPATTPNPRLGRWRALARLLRDFMVSGWSGPRTRSRALSVFACRSMASSGRLAARYASARLSPRPVSSGDLRRGFAGGRPVSARAT